MTQEIAKLILEHAHSFSERVQALETARFLGMPMREIEEYLDWLDKVRASWADDGDDSSQEPGPCALS
jgi:hypothetical protein